MKLPVWIPGLAAALLVGCSDDSDSTGPSPVDTIVSVRVLEISEPVEDTVIAGPARFPRASMIDDTSIAFDDYVAVSNGSVAGFSGGSVRDTLTIRPTHSPGLDRQAPVLYSGTIRFQGRCRAVKFLGSSGLLSSLEGKAVRDGSRDTVITLAEIRGIAAGADPEP